MLQSPDGIEYKDEPSYCEWEEIEAHYPAEGG